MLQVRTQRRCREARGRVCRKREQRSAPVRCGVVGIQSRVTVKCAEGYTEGYGGYVEGHEQFVQRRHGEV